MIGAQSPEGWAALAAGITAGLIAIGLVFAWRQVGEARRLREAQVRPSVVVDFETESTLIHLTVENVGLLPAKDVKLHPIDEFDPRGPMASRRFNPDDPGHPNAAAREEVSLLLR